MRTPSAVVGLMSLWLLLPPGHASQPYAIRAGDSIATVLKALQGPQLQFIFSSQLVPKTLRVDNPPAAGEPLAIAQEVLAPHELRLQQVGANTYAVVRGAPAASSTAPEPVANRTPLPEIVIAASYYQVNNDTVEQSQTLTGAEPGSLLSPGEDSLRAIAHLPGIAATGLSANSYVRGGDRNEVLVLLDGFPIREAFHLPGYQSFFSVFDPALIARTGVYTGGFPARYGDRMSAVFDLHTVDALDEPRRLLGLSVYNAVARAAGTWHNAGGEGDWLTMARIGTPALLLEAMSQDSAKPIYEDLFARVRLPVDKQRDWSLYGLWSHDRLDVSDAESGQPGQFGRLRSSAAYLWLTGQQSLAANASLQFWLGSSHIESSKRGTLEQSAIGIGQVDDVRRAQVWDARGIAHWLVNPANQLEAGLEWSRGTADYHYVSKVSFDPTVAALFSQPASSGRNLQLRPTRNQLSAFVSHRWSISGNLASELGLRVQRVSGLQIAPRTLLDPRVALRWSLGTRTQLRFAWGMIHQADEINELRVEDGLQVFGRPQLSAHLIGGIEHRFTNGIKVRVESFSKRQSDPRERFENLLDPLAVLPELSPDRVRVAPQFSELRGVEISAERRGMPWSWWTSYTYSDATDDLMGQEVARTWDQTHALNAGIDWSQDRWQLTVAANVHSGWPRTPIVTDSAGHAALGLRNSLRLATYSSVDLRGAYEWPMDPGKLTLSLKVSNALNAHNPCCQKLVVTPVSGGSPVISTIDNHWLPLVPEFGIRWEF